MGKRSIIGMGPIWVHRGYRVHYGCAFYHDRICNPLNWVSANRTIDKVISDPRTNGLFLSYGFEDAGKNHSLATLTDSISHFWIPRNPCGCWPPAPWTPCSPTRQPPAGTRRRSRNSRFHPWCPARRRSYCTWARRTRGNFLYRPTLKATSKGKHFH